MLLEDGLKPLWEATQNKKPLYSILAAEMLSAVDKNFETEGARGNIPWPALKKSTIRQRGKKGSWPGKILQVKGALSKSIQSSSTNEYAMVSTNKVYAAIHQFGGEIESKNKVIHFKKHKRGKNKGKTLFSTEKKANFAQKVMSHKIVIPARPFMFLTDEDYLHMNALIADFFIK